MQINIYINCEKNRSMLRRVTVEPLSFDRLVNRSTWPSKCLYVLRVTCSSRMKAPQPIRSAISTPINRCHFMLLSMRDSLFTCVRFALYAKLKL